MSKKDRQARGIYTPREARRMAADSRHQAQLQEEAKKQSRKK